MHVVEVGVQRYACAPEIHTYANVRSWRPSTSHFGHERLLAVECLQQLHRTGLDLQDLQDLAPALGAAGRQGG